MLPIYVKDQDFSPSADTIYYLLSRDGLFLVKCTPFFEAAVPAAGIPWLAPQAPEVRLKAPPLPAALLPWRGASRTYELVVPHQTVGGGHCDYEVREFPPGLMRRGTIYSHAAVAAFHSLRDLEDERFEDGFHLTIGNLDGDLTLVCPVVVQGFRSRLAPQSLFTPCPIPWEQAPPETAWEEEVDQKVTPLPRPIDFGP